LPITATQPKQRTINLLAKQQEFLESSAKYRLFSGGIGNGKTSIGCIEALRLCLEYPGIVGVISRKTMSTLKRTTQKVFLEEVLGEYGFNFVKKWNKTDSLLTFENGSQIYFIDLENITKILGLEVGFWYVDEAKEINFDIWLAIIGRLRQPNTPRCAFLTTNPDAPTHWLYQTFFVKNKNNPEYKVINAKTNENKYLPKDYINTLNSAYSGIHKKRYLDGDWVLFDGLVYNEFNLSSHVIDYDINFGDFQNWRFFCGIDWGYTNPAVCLFCAVDSDENIYVYDEIYQTNLLLPDFINLIKNKISFDRPVNFNFFADPSRPDYISEFLRAGLNITSANNNVLSGIQKVKSKLIINEITGQPKLFITSKCENLIREFQTYKWTEQKDGHNSKEEPVKVDDHAQDALRYFINSYETTNQSWEIPTFSRRGF